MIIKFNIRQWEIPSNDAVKSVVLSVTRVDEGDFDYDDFKAAVAKARAHLESKKRNSILPVNGMAILYYLTQQGEWKIEHTNYTYTMNL